MKQVQERLQAVAADGATAPDTVQELEAMQAAIQATSLPDDVVADVRAYFDLTSLFWAFYDGLGLTASEFNRSMGGHQPELPVAEPNPMQGPRARRINRARLKLL